MEIAVVVQRNYLNAKVGAKVFREALWCTTGRVLTIALPIHYDAFRQQSHIALE